MTIMQITTALSRNPSTVVGAAASMRCLQQPVRSLTHAHARCDKASSITAHTIGLQHATRSAASGRSMSVAARASALP